MNTPIAGQEAVLHYDTPDFAIVKAGTFVRCAVTGKPIPLAQLRYWSSELQEAYVDSAAATQRWREVHGAKADNTDDGSA